MDMIDEEAVFQELQLIDANKRCFDCGQISPQWASVNNGIFICLNCSGIHRSYGVDISFVRSVTMDSWSPKQLKCMQLGGNHSLSEFLSSYDLMSEPMDVRYQTKAAEYYRKKLRAFGNDEEFHEEKPDYEEGRLPIEYKIKSQEEIKNQIGGHAQQPGDSNENVEKAKEIFNEFWNGTKKVTAAGIGMASTGANKVGTKLNESGVTDKVKTGAKVVGDKTVEYGGIAYNKTKEGLIKVATNEKVQEYSSKAYSGAKDVGTSVWGFFSRALNQDSNGAAAPNLGNGPPPAPVPAPQSAATDT